MIIWEEQQQQQQTIGSRSRSSTRSISGGKTRIGSESSSRPTTVANVPEVRAMEPRSPAFSSTQHTTVPSGTLPNGKTLPMARLAATIITSSRPKTPAPVEQQQQQEAAVRSSPSCRMTVEATAAAGSNFSTGRVKDIAAAGSAAAAAEGKRDIGEQPQKQDKAVIKKKRERRKERKKERQKNN
ncbi:hypothetical protein ACSSS7_001299 [Eimeria intestinalis]